MRRCVEGSLDRELQRHQDEPLLFEIRRQELGSGQPIQLREARLDLAELLRDELRIGHEALRSPCR